MTWDVGFREKTAAWEMRGFWCCFMAGSWVFVFGYGIPDLYADKDDVFVQVWQIYELTRERETWVHYGQRSRQIRVSVVCWPGLGF